MGRGKRAASDDERHARARASRRECDSRAAAWHNVLVVMLHALGYALVVRKPSKLRPRTTLPRVPCVRVSRGGEVVYDMHRNVGAFNAQVGAGQKSEGMRKGFNANEKSVVFNALLAELEAACAAPRLAGAVGVVRSARQPSRDGRSGEARHRVERVDFFGSIITNGNVIECGRRVYEFCCRAFRATTKETDVAMVRFPLELWGTPTPAVAAAVPTTPDAVSDDNASADDAGCVRGFFDGCAVLGGLSRASDYDGVVTGAGCN